MSTIHDMNPKHISKKAVAAAFLAGMLALGTLPATAFSAGNAFASDSSQPPAQQSTPPEGEPPDGYGGGSMGQPPDGSNGDQPPEPPNGNNGGNGGQPPEPPDGENPGTPPNGQGVPGGPNTQIFDFTGNYSAAVGADGDSQTIADKTVSATNSGQNVALAQNGGTLTVEKSTLEKSGDLNDGNSTNFYGTNSILLAVGEKSKATVKDSTLNATSTGSNGIFATDKATVFAHNSKITTSKDNSRGLDATYGGTIVADKLNIETAGNHCAGAANDRGGGNVSLTNSSIATQGEGSPVLYSTGTIEVSNIEGFASGSQLAAIEGSNAVRIYDSSLESTITEATASDPFANGIIIYQSTSGDADTSSGSTAHFEACDSSLKSDINSGAMFYFTNTNATTVLQNTDVSFDKDRAKLIQVSGNDANNWGTPGKNGADVTFTARDETLKGDIDVDSISSLDFYLLDETAYTGTTELTKNNAALSSTHVADNANKSENQTNADTEKETNDSDASSTGLSIYIENGSTWVLTEDATVTNLYLEDGGHIVDEEGYAASVVPASEGSESEEPAYIEGEGKLTVTVTGEFGTSFETDETNELSETTIDRTDFDEEFNVETVFGPPTESEETDEGDEIGLIPTVPEEEIATTETEGENGAQEDGGFFGWLASLWQSFLSIFGL